MRNAFEIRINFTGGIVSPGYLLNILEQLDHAGLRQVRFGLRQQLLVDVPARAQKSVQALLDAADITYEVNKEIYPNICSSYPAAEIFIRDTWLGESVYKEVFDLFDYKPTLKVNILDRNQTFTPFFTGNLNWIASGQVHFWWLVIRFPKTNVLYYWKDLVYTNDLAKVSAALEKVMLASPAAYYDNATADGNVLYEAVTRTHTFIVKPVRDKLVLPDFKLPYYEGYNSYGNKSWLGIYRRHELFDIAFLKDICSICLRTKSGELYTTPWKSIIIKGIEDKHRPLWGFILGKYKINVRHASNELNWQVEDGNQEGLSIKRQIIRHFDKEDVRTFGLCFAVKTHPKSGVFGSVLIRKQFNLIRQQLKPLDKYDILYTADFNPNSRQYILFRENVQKEHLAAYLVALCKYYYEQDDINDLLPGSSHTDTAPTDQTDTTTSVVFECQHCLTVYTESSGDPEQQVPAGTAFTDLANTYCCALCEAPKAAFRRKQIIASSATFA